MGDEGVGCRVALSGHGNPVASSCGPVADGQGGLVHARDFGVGVVDGQGEDLLELSDRLS